MLTDPRNSQSASCFLIRSSNESQACLRTHPTVGDFLGDAASNDSHGCGEVEHVHTPSSPNLPVADFPLKRWVRPMLVIDWNNVGVPQKGESFAIGIRSVNGDD